MTGIIRGRGPLQFRHLANPAGQAYDQAAFINNRGWGRLWNNLDPANWRWNSSIWKTDVHSWGGKVGLTRLIKPYSWDVRNQLLREVKGEAIRNVYETKPDVTDVANENVRKTFKRINGLPGGSSGPTRAQCGTQLEELKMQLLDLKGRRDAFRRNGLAAREKIPSLSPEMKGLLLEAAVEEEVVGAVISCPEIKNAANAVAAQAILRTAAQSVADCYAPGTPERGAADAVVQEIQRAMLPPAAVAPAIGAGPAAGAAAAEAVAMANMIRQRLRDTLAAHERVITTRTHFKGSTEMEVLAVGSMQLEKKLKELANHLFNSLCNENRETYRNNERFSIFYDSVWETFEDILDVQNDLEKFKMDLGLPSLRRDKLESKSKYKFKQWISANCKSTRREWAGAFALYGLEYGVSSMLTGGIIPTEFFTFGGMAASIVANTILLKGISWMASDE